MSELEIKNQTLLSNVELLSADESMKITAEVKSEASGNVVSVERATIMKKKNELYEYLCSFSIYRNGQGHLCYAFPEAPLDMYENISSIFEEFKNSISTITLNQ